MGNKELFKTVLFGGFQKEEVWNYMQEVEAEIEGGRQVAERAQQECAAAGRGKPDAAETEPAAFG